MSKREMLHTLLDRVLDIDETSKKGVRFNVSKNFCHIYFKTSDQSGAEDVGKNNCFFLEREDSEESFQQALEEIEKVRNTPDVEPKLTFLLDESKARELGLIA